MSDDGESGRRIAPWVAIVISTLAMLISFVSVYSDYKLRDELTEPHLRHVETRDRLDVLNERIDRAQERIEGIEGKTGEPWEDGRENLSAAKSHRDAAESAWISGNYTSSNHHIKLADENVSNILRSTPPSDGGIPGWTWIVIVLLVIAAAVGGWYYYDQQRQQ